MARYIDRDKIEYELILGANGHFIAAARKEFIDRLPVEDVEPVKPTQIPTPEQEEDAWLKHEIRRDTFDAVFISIVAAAVLVLCCFAIGGRA